MWRMQIKLNDCERQALGTIALAERRNPRDQAALIIRRELERLGYIQPNTEVLSDNSQPQPA